MGFFKGLIISFLSLLLFISLSLFGLVFMCNQTLLNASFVTSQIEKLDVASLTEEFISSELPFEHKYEELVSQALKETVAELDPWLKDEAGKVINRSYAYLLGKSHTLKFSVPLEEFKAALKDNLWEVIQENPPPELKAIPQAWVERYFDQYYKELTKDVPQSFDFDLNSIEPEVREELEQAREIIGYVKIAFWALIGLILLLVLGIYFLSGSPSTSSRNLGTTFLLYGIFEFAFVLLAKSYLLPKLHLGLPSPTLDSFMLGLMGDMLSPLQIFSLGVGVVGLALIIASFFLRGKEEI